MSGPDFDEQRPIRRGRRRHLLVVLGIAVALGVLLGGSVALGWLDMSSNREPPKWAEVFGLVLAAVGTIVILCLFVWIRLVITYAGQALLQWSRLWLAFLIVFGPLFAVAVVQTIRDARRAEAFLRAHPVQGEP